MNSKCTSIATVASHFTVGTWGETQQCMRCIYLVDMSPQEKGTHPLLFKGDYKQLDHKSSTPVEDWHSRPSFYSVIDVQWTPTVQGSHVSEWMTHDSPKRFCSLYTSPWLPCTNHPTSWHSGQHRLQGQSKFKTKQKWTPCKDSLWSLHSREYLWFRLSGILSCGARTLVSLWGAILSLWTEVGLINPWSQRRMWTQGLHYQDAAAPWSQVRSLLELSVKKACCFSWWDRGQLAGKTHV